jgi:hypothetical protein
MLEPVSSPFVHDKGVALGAHFVSMRSWLRPAVWRLAITATGLAGLLFACDDREATVGSQMPGYSAGAAGIGASGGAHGGGDLAAGGPVAGGAGAGATTSDIRGCPAETPTFGKPCATTETCVYPRDGDLCDWKATCREDRWWLDEIEDGVCWPRCAFPYVPGEVSPICSTEYGPFGKCWEPREECTLYAQCVPGDADIAYHAIPQGAAPADTCCPPEEPAIGSVCDQPRIVCAYGSPQPKRPFGNELVCNAYRRWQSRIPYAVSEQTNDEGCPAGDAPSAGDVCDEYRRCYYPPTPTACARVMTCRRGAWRRDALPGCGIEGLCPDEEPSAPDVESCDPGPPFGSAPASCAYDHHGCVAHLTCNGSQKDPRWLGDAGPPKPFCESCCRGITPVKGLPCRPNQTGVLCGPDAPGLICRDGVWSERSVPLALKSFPPATAEAGNPATCPSTLPLTADPCSLDVACYYQQAGCELRLSCENGHWRLDWTPGAGCGLPAACPADEPLVPDIEGCQGGTGTRYVCRYPHEGCFRYLVCPYASDGRGRWSALSSGPAIDDCCPEIQPALGTACEDEGALCAWAPGCGPRTELTCREGSWQPRSL